MTQKPAHKNIETDIAILGGGFCGTMAAINILRLHPHARVCIIDRHNIGAGLAYGTTDPDHRLNVRADQMGAFADNPRHFWDWLSKQKDAAGLTENSFAPRMLYGRYLQSLLEQSRVAQMVIADIVSMRRDAGRFVLTSATGDVISAKNVILALGNFLPNQPDSGAPYAPETWKKLAEDGDILIIGTGLTSLDLLVTMEKMKRKGTIHLLSRHGLLPHEHADRAAYSVTLEKLPATAHNTMLLLRGEIAKAAKQGIAWQNVIDAFRPYNQQIWQNFSESEKERFLRHIRPYWEVHRHRCPPEAAAAYKKLSNNGRLKLHRGSITGQVRTPDGWNFYWRPRGKDKIENLTVREAVYCTGAPGNIYKLDDALMKNLLEQKLVSPDPTRLGIMADNHHAVLSASGKYVEGLYVLGGLLKGQLYESVAVPELRVQASNVARQIVR